MSMWRALADAERRVRLGADPREALREVAAEHQVDELLLAHFMLVKIVAVQRARFAVRWIEPEPEHPGRAA